MKAPYRIAGHRDPQPVPQHPITDVKRWRRLKVFLQWAFEDDTIWKPHHGPVMRFVLRTHPLVWYGTSALIGLVIGFLR